MPKRSRDRKLVEKFSNQSIEGTHQSSPMAIQSPTDRRNARAIAIQAAKGRKSAVEEAIQSSAMAKEPAKTGIFHLKSPFKRPDNALHSFAGPLRQGQDNGRQDDGTNFAVADGKTAAISVCKEFGLNEVLKSTLPTASLHLPASIILPFIILPFIILPFIVMPTIILPLHF